MGLFIYDKLIEFLLSLDINQQVIDVFVLFIFQ